MVPCDTPHRATKTCDTPHRATRKRKDPETPSFSLVVSIPPIEEAMVPGGSPGLYIPQVTKDIHRIYKSHRENPLVVGAQGLKIPLLSTLPEDTSFDDLSCRIPLFLSQLKLEMTVNRVTKGEKTGEHNLGIYLVSTDDASLRVVKIHHPFKTNIYTFWNLYGVAICGDLKEQRYDLYSHLPKLCYDISMGSFEHSGVLYHFSVMEAAQGRSASDILRREDKEAKTKAIAVIGKSIGYFHAYHALYNDSLREKFQSFMEGKEDSFPTINHMDLNLDNIFVDDLGNVTLVDLEAMFSSVVSPRSNLVDWYKLRKHVPALFGEESVSILDQHYREGLSETWTIYKQLNPPTAVPNSSTAEGAV